MNEADAILVRRALEGDTAGFVRLIQRYYPALVAMAHAVVVSSSWMRDSRDI